MLQRDVPLVPTFNINFALMDEGRVSRGEVPPWAVEKMRYLFKKQQANFRHAVERGVRVIMGTDSFNGLYPPAELAYLSEFGIGPFRAIQAATTEAAKLLGIDDEVGTLEPGMAADLIAVSGDPLAEPDLWHDPARIVLVIQNGRVVADRRGA
jgi:imidazolonepropionase-like amidohydrolase